VNVASGNARESREFVFDAALRFHNHADWEFELARALLGREIPWRAVLELLQSTGLVSNRRALLRRGDCSQGLGERERASPKSRCGNADGLKS
jgi:hypothetical protein